MQRADKVGMVPSSSQSSFEKAKSWVKELQRQANPNIVIALVGNKIDLLQQQSSSSSSSVDEAAEGEDGDKTVEAAPASASR